MTIEGGNVSSSCRFLVCNWSHGYAPMVGSGADVPSFCKWVRIAVSGLAVLHKLQSCFGGARVTTSQGNLMQKVKCMICLKVLSIFNHFRVACIIATVYLKVM